MSVKILNGDCRAILPTLPDESVHCVVTSPPYWGLRDYGTATWDGGDPDCDHSAVRRNHNGEKQQTSAGTSRDKIDGQNCRLCGAIRIDSQIGLEPTPESYVSTMVDVFREVRRVLRKDGTLWLNLGDSYASGGRGGGANGSKQQTNVGALLGPKSKPLGLKDKDLVGIPWRVAFALQADGWYLRQDIVWQKPNSMPESVTDRCTKSHEYIFLLSKSARYYYDAEAIAEEFADDRMGNPNGGGQYAKDAFAYIGPNEQSGLQKGQWNIDGLRQKRNKRSVWTVATQSFSEAHFATFPPALIEPCILAGCPKGGTVLDPFGGAGTTGMVADRLQRNAILIELNADYVDMSKNRINADAPLFASVVGG